LDTETDLEPVSGLTLHQLLDRMYKSRGEQPALFIAPVITTISEDIKKLYPLFFEKDKIDTIGAYMAKNEILVDRLTQQEMDKGGGKS